MHTLQELILPLLTVLFLVALALMVSRTQSKTDLSNSAVQDVEQVVAASHIFCSPDTSEVRKRMNRTLMYLKAPWPQLSYYESAAVVEEAYLNVTTSAHAADNRVVGIDFVDTAAPSTVHYALRFKAADVADTTILFNHARKQLWSFILCSFCDCLWFTETLAAVLMISSTPEVLTFWHYTNVFIIIISVIII